MHCNDQITLLEKEFSLTEFYFQVNGISLGTLDGGWSFDSLSHCFVYDCHHCGLSYYLQKTWLPWSVCIFTIFWGNLRLKLSNEHSAFLKRKINFRMPLKMKSQGHLHQHMPLQSAKEIHCLYHHLTKWSSHHLFHIPKTHMGDFQITHVSVP